MIFDSHAVASNKHNKMEFVGYKLAGVWIWESQVGHSNIGK